MIVPVEFVPQFVDMLRIAEAPIVIAFESTPLSGGVSLFTRFNDKPVRNVATLRSKLTPKIANFFIIFFLLSDLSYL